MAVRSAPQAIAEHSEPLRSSAIGCNSEPIGHESSGCQISLILNSQVSAVRLYVRDMGFGAETSNSRLGEMYVDCSDQIQRVSTVPLGRHTNSLGHRPIHF